MKLAMSGYLLLMMALSLNTNASATLVETGEQIFVKQCKSCHNIDRKLIGPALKDVHLRRDSVWLFNFINGSSQMISDGDSVAVALFKEYNKIPMPGQKLDRDQFAAIMAYFREASVAKPYNPIKRPTAKRSNNYAPLSFGAWQFWVPFTIAVGLFLVVVYYQTIVTDLRKNPDS